MFEIIREQSHFTTTREGLCWVTTTREGLCWVTTTREGLCWVTTTQEGLCWVTKTLSTRNEANAFSFSELDSRYQGISESAFQGSCVVQ
jgi:hypothetical protein